MTEKKINAAGRIIFPLDLPSLGEALDYARALKDDVGLFKIGLELFVAEGPAAIEAVKRAAPECGIFLDMKFNDIPATVRGAYASAAGLGAEFVTVHLTDTAMLRAMGEVETDTKILGVTVLTSLSSEDLAEQGIGPELCDPAKLVLKRAALALSAGLSGIVCSPLEVEEVRQTLGDDLIIVTPGIRPSSGRTADDQKRVATPYGAILSGSDYLVIGRPIRQASDPVSVAKEIAEEIAKALADKG